MDANKRVLFIEHDHVSEGGPIWAQFSKRGYDISRFNIVAEPHFNQPNVSVIWPDLLSFDIVVVMGSPWGVWEDERIGNWLLPELKLVKEVHNAGFRYLEYVSAANSWPESLVALLRVDQKPNWVGTELKATIRH